uniref:Uncharacterized protein n=1 Tax=Triticum urartu TaxID=4572 RepID=A0A8R7JWN0_TRIUA
MLDTMGEARGASSSFGNTRAIAAIVFYLEARRSSAATATTPSTSRACSPATIGIRIDFSSVCSTHADKVSEQKRWPLVMYAILMCAYTTSCDITAKRRFTQPVGRPAVPRLLPGICWRGTTARESSCYIALAGAWAHWSLLALVAAASSHRWPPLTADLTLWNPLSWSSLR